MDKAVILARGLGTRMRQQDPEAGLSVQQAEVAATGVKALIPIDRPFLDYVLSALADAGYRRICLVVGPEHEALRRYYGEVLKYQRLELGFAIQEQPLGTADAVAAAEGFAAGDSVLVINSDNYYPAVALEALRHLQGPGLAAFSRAGMLAGSNIPPERLSRFALVEADEQQCLRRIVEKPDPALLASLPEPVAVSMNCWRFDAGIFPACRAVKPSPRGELELPDAVQYAAEVLGQRFRVLCFAEAVLDLSSRIDVGPVSERLAGREVKL
ncbi:MAG: nucleotidyltransferase family protein [Candidatus Latescibacteria bacterium]|nr:nucleotidyltransferase family protein [Candidatus Latescibacterota bacterium]